MQTIYLFNQNGLFSYYAKTNCSLIDRWSAPHNKMYCIYLAHIKTAHVLSSTFIQNVKGVWLNPCTELNFYATYFLGCCAQCSFAS